MDRKLEICCESCFDVIQAELGGADRVELNSALAIGGVTPSMGELLQVRERTSIPVIVMIRPRGAGFCYDETELSVMQRDAELLLQNGADGIAFGILNKKAEIAEKESRKLIELAHEYGKEAVFHRAFDCTADQRKAIETLIALKADRVLSSGQSSTAVQGKERLRELQKEYGDEIQILAGSGVNAENAAMLMQDTGISQLHSSCKIWTEDATTSCGEVSFAIESRQGDQYHCVSCEKVKKIAAAMRNA